MEFRVSWSSNEEYPKRGVVNKQRWRLSDASDGGGGRSPARDTTTLAPREVPVVWAAETASSALRSLTLCYP